MVCRACLPSASDGSLCWCVCVFDMIFVGFVGAFMIPSFPMVYVVFVVIVFVVIVIVVFVFMVLIVISV